MADPAEKLGGDGGNEADNDTGEVTLMTPQESLHVIAVEITRMREMFEEAADVARRTVLEGLASLSPGALAGMGIGMGMGMGRPRPGRPAGEAVGSTPPELPGCPWCLSLGLVAGTGGGFSCSACGAILDAEGRVMVTGKPELCRVPAVPVSP